MIQRKQSIWFLLAAIVLLASFFVPVGSKDLAQTHFDITTSQLSQQTANAQQSLILEYAIIGIGFMAIGVLMLINIFVYKNRQLQKSIALFGILFTVLLYFGLTYECRQLPEGMNEIKFQIGAFLPCIAVFFMFLGIKGINSDIKLLKSADRLR